MSEQKPSIGRIVHYKLTAEDAAQVNRRRTNGKSIGERIASGKWPEGAQAHIGNGASENDTRPMVITQVWPDGKVNGQVLLDGNDALWVTSITEGDKPGAWAWPPRA